MPDVPLRDQDGGEIRLRDFRGKALAITFFYSRCTAAAFCPLVGRNFDATQALLLRMGAAERCHLLSISLDPKRDTPEMLSAYARGYQADAVAGASPREGWRTSSNWETPWAWNASGWGTGSIIICGQWSWMPAGASAISSGATVGRRRNWRRN